MFTTPKLPTEAQPQFSQFLCDKQRVVELLRLLAAKENALGFCSKAYAHAPY
jgi:hypothetical protein